MGLLRIAAVVGVLISLGLAASPSLADYQYEPAEGVDRAQKFDLFPVHWAGDAVGGVPLETVLGGRERRNTGWSFIYGDCEPPPFQGGCAPPLEVQTWSTCFRYRDIYPGKQRSHRFRGAQASRDGGAPFEIYTGRVTIAIFGKRDLVRETGQLVRRILDATPRRLAPPVKGSLRGKLRCQPPPSELPVTLVP